MTANRWWVRYAARWLARVNSVEGLVKMASLAATGMSTSLLVLEAYGYSQYARPFVIIAFLGGIIFTYLYAEGGVYNQMRRDYSDISTNYATPKMLMARTMSTLVMFRVFHGRPPTPQERQEIYRMMDSVWRKYRTGLEVDESGELAEDWMENLEQEFSEDLWDETDRQSALWREQ